MKKIQLLLALGDTEISGREQTASVSTCSRLVVTVPLKKMPRIAASKEGLNGTAFVIKEANHVQETYQVEPVGGGLCTRLVLEAMVYLLGQLLRHQSPFLINY